VKTKKITVSLACAENFWSTDAALKRIQAGYRLLLHPHTDSSKALRNIVSCATAWLPHGRHWYCRHVDIKPRTVQNMELLSFSWYCKGYVTV